MEEKVHFCLLDVGVVDLARSNQKTNRNILVGPFALEHGLHSAKQNIVVEPGGPVVDVIGVVLQSLGVRRVITAGNRQSPVIPGTTRK